MPTAQQIEKTTALFLQHRLRVSKYLTRMITSLVERSADHDDSKLLPEEFELYAEAVDEFDKYVFGSPEYEALRTRLGPAIQHHYQSNRHHPEYFNEGINSMNLVDILEMLADWKSATQNRGGNGDLMKSIGIMTEKYGISPQLRQILINTARDFGML